MSKPQWNKVLRQRIEDAPEWHLLNEDGVMVAKVFPDTTWEVYRSTGVGLKVIRRGGPWLSIAQSKLHAQSAASEAGLIPDIPSTEAQEQDSDDLLAAAFSDYWQSKWPSQTRDVKRLELSAHYRGCRDAFYAGAKSANDLDQP